MKDDTEKKDRKIGNRASSLVERAANRIVTDRGAVQSKEALPRDASLSGDGASADYPVTSAKNLSNDAADVGNPQPVEAVRSAIAGGWASEPQARRSSRLVKVDIPRLTSQNILTPQSKRSKTVEEMRLIKRRVLVRRRISTDALSNTIIVTSALPEEGKTTIAINLAMSIAAEEDVRVLLIDADFIRPNALRQLGVTSEKGLIDVLENPNLDIADVMLKTDVEKLSLIPSGRLHDRCTELLASARMSEIVHELSTRYEDRILIFDSPPVLATTEAVTLASHMGQVIFVVQAGRTRRQVVDSSLELLGDRQRVGLVLNQARPTLGSAEFGSYYGSYNYHRADA